MRFVVLSVSLVGQIPGYYLQVSFINITYIIQYNDMWAEHEENCLMR
jgi:hypothetical protein